MTLLTFEKFHEILSKLCPFYDFANNNRKSRQQHILRTA